MLCTASIDDIALLSTVKAGFSEADVVARFQWLATVNVTWHVWWETHQPCGWALIQWAGKPTAPYCPDLFDLYVNHNWRGQSIGTQILSACEKIVAARGFTKLGLAVNPDDNPRAYALYQKLGYAAIRQARYLDGVYNGVEDWVIDLEKQLWHDS